MGNHTSRPAHGDAVTAGADGAAASLQQKRGRSGTAEHKAQVQRKQQQQLEEALRQQQGTAAAAAAGGAEVSPVAGAAAGGDSKRDGKAHRHRHHPRHRHHHHRRHTKTDATPAAADAAAAEPAAEPAATGPVAVAADDGATATAADAAAAAAASSETSYADEAEEDEDEDGSDDFVGNFTFDDDHHLHQQQLAALSPSLKTATSAGVKVLTQDDLVREQHVAAGEVAELFEIDSHTALVLLRHYRWNREALVTAYVEDADRVCRLAGAPPPKEARRRRRRLLAEQKKAAAAAASSSDRRRRHHHHHHRSSTASGAAAAMSEDKAGKLKKKKSSSAAVVAIGSSGSSAVPSRPAAAADLSASEQLVDCSICGETYGSRDGKTSAMQCRHRFCNDCWEQYLSTKIQADGQAGRIACPHVGCPVVVEDAMVRRLVKPEVFSKYVRFLSKSFVEENALARWCPAVNCGRAVHAQEPVHGSVKCHCGHRFCFRCQSEAHAPISCELLKVWEQKCKDDSETTNWLRSFTKQCPNPRCRVAIEKNEGCMHMNCRSCAHEFCWVCMQPWRGHSDYYSCNRYEKKAAEDAAAAAAAAAAGEASSRKSAAKKKKKNKKKNKKRGGGGDDDGSASDSDGDGGADGARAQQQLDPKAALDRYLFYYNRYMAHARSFELERQKRETARANMQRLQEADATPGEVQFIADAIEQLLECRLALKFTYVFAYFMQEGRAKDLFQYLQEDLERTTEDLSRLLLDPPQIKLESRVQIVSMTKLAANWLNNLLDSVESGLVDEAIRALPA